MYYYQLILWINFRTLALKDYGLDPVYYVLLPNFSWDACLKYTKEKLELLTNYDMHLMFEKSKHGSIATTYAKRYSKADDDAIKLTEYIFNNKELPDDLKCTKKKFLMHLDANNLYGDSMSKPLPYKNFKWVTDKDGNISDNDWKDIQECERKYLKGENITKGYLFEVDLEYPKELHNYHNDLPLAPEKINPKVEWFSKIQKDYVSNHKEYKPNGKFVNCKFI